LYKKYLKNKLKLKNKKIKFQMFLMLIILRIYNSRSSLTLIFSDSKKYAGF